MTSMLITLPTYQKVVGGRENPSYAATLRYCIPAWFLGIKGILYNRIKGRLTGWIRDNVGRCPLGVDGMASRDVEGIGSEESLVLVCSAPLNNDMSSDPWRLKQLPILNIWITQGTNCLQNSKIIITKSFILFVGLVG